MGLFSGIGNALGGVFDAMKGVMEAAQQVTRILRETGLGSMLAMAVPGGGTALAAVELTNMLGNVVNSVGNGENY